MTPGQDAQWAISKALDQIKDNALKSAGGFMSHPIAKVLPFVEQMLTTETTHKEFWWERDWRHRGDFSFRQAEVALVFCPEAEIDDIEGYGPPAVDLSWSLERMIDQLARSAVDVAVLRHRRRRIPEGRRVVSRPAVPAPTQAANPAWRSWVRLWTTS